jgi:hypothetical protein
MDTTRLIRTILAMRMSATLDEVSLKSNWLMSTRMPPKSTYCPDMVKYRSGKRIEKQSCTTPAVEYEKVLLLGKHGECGMYHMNTGACLCRLNLIQDTGRK